MARQLSSSFVLGVVFLLGAVTAAAQDDQPVSQTSTTTQRERKKEFKSRPDITPSEREKAIARKRNKYRVNRRFWAL